MKNTKLTALLMTAFSLVTFEEAQCDTASQMKSETNQPMGLVGNCEDSKLQRSEETDPAGKSGDIADPALLAPRQGCNMDCGTLMKKEIKSSANPEGKSGSIAQPVDRTRTQIPGS